MRRSLQSGEHSAPRNEPLPAEVIITHPDHPYCGRQAFVVRVKSGAHVDLLLKFEDGHQMSVDAGWTDFRERAGESPPGVTHLFDVGRARRFLEMVGRLRKGDGKEGAVVPEP